jgi:hypothetical protein
VYNYHASRALSKISSTVVAEAWKSNEINTIKTIYYKSCINQMVFSLILFVGIWANMDSLLHLLPAKYASIQWVVFWICLGSFIDMATGITIPLLEHRLILAQSVFMLVIVAIIIDPTYFIPIME